MTATLGHIDCTLYRSAFSGELVVCVTLVGGGTYEGVAPKHYTRSMYEPAKSGVHGTVQVYVLSKGRKEARVRVPDGEVFSIPADKVHVS